MTGATRAAAEAITPLVLTFNEETNLAATLAQLMRAHETVVVDSFSTDRTTSIAAKQRGVGTVSRRFDSHLSQWTAGVAECRTLWVLALDADYVLSLELIQELKQFEPASVIDAYYCRFRYCVQGRTLRGSLYPPRAVLSLAAAEPAQARCGDITLTRRIPLGNVSFSYLHRGDTPAICDFVPRDRRCTDHCDRRSVRAGKSTLADCGSLGRASACRV